MALTLIELKKRLKEYSKEDFIEKESAYRTLGVYWRRKFFVDLKEGRKRKQ